MLVSFNGYFLGILTGMIFSTEAQAGQILPVIMIPVTLLGGLVVNLNDIPDFISWMQYISAIRHGYSCLMINQLGTPKFHEISDNE